MNDFVNLFVEKKLRGVPIFGLNYLNRVKNFVELFSSGLDFDEELLNLAVLLHCVEARQLIDFGLDFHLASSSSVKNFLIKSNKKLSLINNVVDCVRNAGVDGKPKLVEGKILQNAVLSEFLGVTGVTYALYIAGVKKFSSKKLVNYLQDYLNKVNSVELLDSSRKIIVERKLFFESFLMNLVNDFSRG